MREIKFRAWNKRTGEWHLKSDDSQLTYYGFHLFGECTLLCPPEASDLQHLDIMQYTGLKDKNGADVYESDVVEFTYWWFDGNIAESNLTGVIVYCAESMSFQLKGVKNKEWERFTGHENDSEYLTPFSELNFEEADFKVIGNLFEHPNLLNDKGE